MDKRRLAVWLDIIMRALIVVGALNWGLVGAFDFNLVEWLNDRTFDHLDTAVYCLVGISALFYFFARDYYLPFLGRSAMPCGSLVQKVPENATISVPIQAAPGVNVIYWAAEEGDHVKKDPIIAYSQYTNAGVVQADQKGVAVLRVRKPAAYHVPGKTLAPHIHYRTCESDGMLGRVYTVYVGEAQK